MQWVELSAQQRARRRFAVIGAAVIVASLAGLLVGWSEAQSKDLTPAEVVAFRFPSTWSSLAAKPAFAITAVTKQNQILFEPNPSYDLASADSKPVIPSGVLAYADPVESIPPSSAARAPAARHRLQGEQVRRQARLDRRRKRRGAAAQERRDPADHDVQ